MAERISLAVARGRLVEQGIRELRRGRAAGWKEEAAIRGYERCLDLATPEDFERVITRLTGEAKVAAADRNATYESYTSLLVEEASLRRVYGALKVGWGVHPHGRRDAARYAAAAGSARLPAPGGRARRGRR